MKKLMTGLLMSVLVLTGGLSLSHHQVEAAGNGAQNTDFEVIPIKPATQVNRNQNYFDLDIDPGKTETIEMTVTNYADHKITVHSDLRSAYTQINGDVGFTKSLTYADSKINPSFTSVASLPKKYAKIELGPRESKQISATIKMPEGKQRGFIYGDWHFIEYARNRDKAGNGTAGATSDYSYSVGVALRGTHYKVYPELKYEKVEPILSNGVAGMTVNMRNTQPMMVSGVTAKAMITKKGLFSSKHVKTVTNKEIAPNSMFRVSVPWDMDRLKPGKYTVDVAVQGINLWNSLPMTWKFKKEFTIKDNQIKKINAAALKKPTNKWAYMATAAGVLTAISATAWVKLIKVN